MNTDDEPLQGPEDPRSPLSLPDYHGPAPAPDHDDRLEPPDDVVANLLAEIVRQRERDENLLSVEKYAHECSAEDLLNDAAVLLRAYEIKKGEK